MVALIVVNVCIKAWFFLLLSTVKLLDLDYIGHDAHSLIWQTMSYVGTIYYSDNNIPINTKYWKKNRPIKKPGSNSLYIQQFRIREETLSNRSAGGTSITV